MARISNRSVRPGGWDWADAAAPINDEEEVQLSVQTVGGIGGGVSLGDRGGGGIPGGLHLLQDDPTFFESVNGEDENGVPSCCVLSFDYPKDIKPYIYRRYETWPHTYKGGQTIWGRKSTISVWQVGVEFDVEAEFLSGEDKGRSCECGCCEFRQQVKAKIKFAHDDVPDAYKHRVTLGRRESVEFQGDLDERVFREDTELFVKRDDGTRHKVGENAQNTLDALGLSEQQLVENYPDVHKLGYGHRGPSDPEEDKKLGRIPLEVNDRNDKYTRSRNDNTSDRGGGCVYTMKDVPYQRLLPGQACAARYEFEGKIVKGGCHGDSPVQRFSFAWYVKITRDGNLAFPGRVQYELSRNIWDFGGNFNASGRRRRVPGKMTYTGGRGRRVGGGILYPDLSVWVYKIPSFQPKVGAADRGFYKRAFKDRYAHRGA